MTEHEMIMLGVLNKKKCLPLKSFARFGGRKGMETVAPSGRKKGEKKTFTVLYLAKLSLCASHPQH